MFWMSNKKVKFFPFSKSNTEQDRGATIRTSVTLPPTQWMFIIFETRLTCGFVSKMSDCPPF